MNKTSGSDSKKNSIRPFDSSRIDAPSGIDTLRSWLKKSARLPIEIEIGCGVGWHAIRHSLENPDRRLIAFERTSAKFMALKTRLAGHDPVENLMAIHGDVTHWLPHALQDEKVEKYFLLYPNPEPKSPNQRWLRSPFMHFMIDSLAQDGEIQLATNEKWYADEADEWARTPWGLKLVSRREISPREADTARTHFERKYLRRGETCFDLRWRKVRD